MELQLTLDRSRRIPLARQIAHGVRDAIFTQRIGPGKKLPPTRELAKRLQVSRMIIVEAYEWLIAEGYAESRRGSGTYVRAVLPVPAQPGNRLKDPPRRTDVLPAQPVGVDFKAGLPALDLFPRTAWKAALSKALKNVKAEHLGYGPVEGLPQLRRVIAQYAGRTRGLPVAPEQVVITLGTAQATDLILRTLSPLQGIAIENPGPEPIHRLARLYHGRPEAVPVDAFGLRVDLLKTGSNASKVAHVIPSHQFPTGVSMNLERRLELLTWANRNDAMILEDDYDSEFRYDQAPPIALAALNPSNRVIYLGSFSKTMLPGLRLGFCIVPERIIGRFLQLKWFSDRCVPVLEQLALTEWLESGEFERHVRKMRKIYARRREALIQALQSHFGKHIHVHGVAAGMHVLVDFRLDLTESELIAAGLEAGVRVYPSSPCYIGKKPATPGIILGFGHLSETDIIRGVELLSARLHPGRS